MNNANGDFKRFNGGSKLLDEIRKVRKSTNDQSILGFHSSSSNQEKEGNLSAKHKEMKSKFSISTLIPENPHKELNAKSIQNITKPKMFVKIPGYIQGTNVKNFVHMCYYCGALGHVRSNCFQLYS